MALPHVSHREALERRLDRSPGAPIALMQLCTETLPITAHALRSALPGTVELRACVGWPGAFFDVRNEEAAADVVVRAVLCAGWAAVVGKASRGAQRARIGDGAQAIVKRRASELGLVAGWGALASSVRHEQSSDAGRETRVEVWARGAGAATREAVARGALAGHWRRVWQGGVPRGEQLARLTLEVPVIVPAGQVRGFLIQCTDGGSLCCCRSGASDPSAHAVSLTPRGCAAGRRLFHGLWPEEQGEEYCISGGVLFELLDAAQ
jgi:hypothetical protein